MSELTTNPNDPRLGKGQDDKPIPQNEVYLVLSKEEIAKGFVRPLRQSYQHVGLYPKYPLRDLTEEEHERYDKFGYIKYEEYPKDLNIGLGRFWTKAMLNNNSCNHITKMHIVLCETYARQPTFYGSTYCVGCQMHKPVEEFIWVEDGARVGS